MKTLVKQILCLSLVLGTTSQAQTYDIRTGLVSYYPFNTSTTADAAFTNNFTAAGSPTLVITNPAPRGSALQLNGTSQYLTNAHPTDNAVNGFPVYNSLRYSVAMWVKGAPQVTKYLFTSGSTSSGNPLFCLQTGNAASDANKLDLIIRNDGGGTLVNHAVSSNVVFDSTWHHIAWVDDNGRASLYVDGKLDGNSPLFNYARSGVFTFNRTAVGALQRAAVAGQFAGTIDDLSIWERLLTQSEVQNIMTNGISTPVPALPATIYIQPSNVTKNFKDNVTFSVSAAGIRPNSAITYQWRSNSIPILDATNRTYRIFNLTTDYSGQKYSVSVSNSIGGEISSDATLTVLPDGLVDLRNQAISHWPMDTVTENSGMFTTVDLYSRNDLILSNITTSSSEAHLGNSLLFDFFPTTSPTVAVRSSGITTYKTNGYSISMWVKVGGASQIDHRVFSEASTTDVNPLFIIGTASPSTSARILIRNDAGITLLNRNTTRPVFDDAWHHIVWVDVDGQAKLFIDGEVDETDFDYTPSPLTLNITSFGATARPTLVANTGIFGYLDEIAIWKRGLTYTDVQEVKNSNIPVPLGPLPISIVTQPASVNAFTKADVTFNVVVTGTGPFSYEWRKGGTPFGAPNSATLSLSNVQLSDAGTYSVGITGASGTTNSQDVVLNVSPRPAPPASLAIDFNNRVETFFTEPGFESFTLDGNSSAANATVNPTMRLYGGVEVTVVGSNGTTIDSRRRGTPVNAGSFTQGNLLQDFVFSTPSTGTDGLDVTIKFMTPNQEYLVTLWSFDSGVGAGNHISDWSANGVLVKDNYTFVSATLPANNAQYQFSFLVTSDANGQIVIQGRRDSAAAATAAVFLNALKIAPTTPPSILQQPTSRNVYVGTDVSFLVAASGLEPFTFQWFKGTNLISGQTNATLFLPSVQLSDIGAYSVTVSNQFGATNSAAATLSVTERPAPQVSLGIDFNNRNAEAGFTEDKFESFTLDDTAATTLSTTRLFGGTGGVEVTVVGSSGTTTDSRRRLLPLNSGDFTQEKLLQDFVFSPPVDGTNGLDVTLKFLTPNKTYSITLWSYDQSNAGPRVSDWFANSVLVKNDYTFDGTIAPTNNLQNQFTFTAVSDAEGTIVIQGRREESGVGVSVFLNALTLEATAPEMRVTQVESVGGNIRLTLQTPDSSKQHTVEQTSRLSPISWSTVTGVTTTILSPTSLQLEFAQPIDSMHFYRINRVP